MTNTHILTLSKQFEELKQFLDCLPLSVDKQRFWCPGIANYSQALYGVKNTYGYDDIFTELGKVAHDEILKNG